MITNLAIITGLLVHTTLGRYPRQLHETSFIFNQQQELNPEIQYSYGDDDIFNVKYLSNINFPTHNSIEKPVDEPQEYVPPQSVGSASIPLLPPPAVPVNAAASNVPTANGAVYLGSGSIGVVRLGNGAFALGSGSLGYSDGRSQPRPSIKVPVYPRLPASPNLIPAAVPSQQPKTPQPSQIQGFHYVYPSGFVQDPNSYEVLQPTDAGFGMPVYRPPRPLRMHFATPTTLRNLPRGSHQYTLQLSPAIPGVNPDQYQYIFNHQ